MRVVLVSLVAGCAQTILLDGMAPPNPVGVGTIVEACEAEAPETVTLEVRFPGREAGCAWGEGGNLEAEQSVLTARTEDVVSLEMPRDVAICDVGLDFRGPDAGDEQIMTYDDHFLLTLDDVVLAASYSPLVDMLEADGLLRLYEWDRVVGATFSFEDFGSYCLGGEEGLSTCTIPPPATPGALTLDFGDDVVEQLAEYAYAEQRYDFAFVVVGDNDPEVDCSHAAFDFSVDVSYVAY